MLKNYLKTGFRNIIKNKVFSVINIFGLSVSMSVCLLIILIITQQFKIDRFHEKGDHIYRIITHDLDDSGPFNTTASSPKVISDALLNNYTYLDNATKLRSGNYSEAEANLKFLNMNLMFADEHFFEVFDFDLKQGSKHTALVEPFSIILSHKTSEKFFGNQNAIGETVKIKDLGIFKVTGVFQKSQYKSHLESDCYISLSSEPLLLKEKKLHAYKNVWNDVWSGYNYLLVKEGTDLRSLENDINKLTKENQTFDDEKNSLGYSFTLQNIEDISPGPLLGNEISMVLPTFVLYFFSFLGLIVLIAACFNYTNLSIAKSLNRSKEIGIRKVTGARRSQVFFQFISESIIISLISLIIAVLIYKMLLPGFNDLWLLQEIGIEYTEDFSLIYFFLAFSLFTGVLAGIIPAMRMSNFSPLEALRNKFSSKGFVAQKSVLRKISLKKTLMVLQFSFSLIFIVTVILLSKQTTYITNADYGFDKNNILNVDMQGLESRILFSEFSKNPAVQSYSLSSHSPATGSNRASSFKKNKNDEGLRIYYFGVDQNYIKNMGIELLAGRNFPQNASSENEQFLILNEKAIHTLGYKSSEEALGEFLFASDSNRLQIIGVVKDYFFQPMVTDLRPMALRYLPNNFKYLNLKLSTNNIQETKADLEKIWLEIDQKRDFKCRFLSDEMEAGYAMFIDINNILKFISLLVISISCLGMLGMAAFTAQTRIKEIGIRKVLGANIMNLVLLLSKGFLWLLLITVVIATPLAYILNSLWLNEMAHRIDFEPGIIIVSIMLLLTLGISTIISQTIGVALRNPVNALRTE